MDANAPADIRELQQQLEAAEHEAGVLVAGLSEEQGAWRAEAGSWSVAECLDHLATGNVVYLRAMQEPAHRARRRGSHRRRPARPGWVGRMFVRMIEPPPMWWSRLRSPRSIRPRPAPPLAETFAAFVAAQADVGAFLRANADLDLAGVRFPNPFALADEPGRGAVGSKSSWPEGGRMNSMSVERIFIAVAVVVGTILVAGLIGNLVGDAVSERAGQLASTGTIAAVAAIALVVFLIRWRSRRRSIGSG